MSKFSVFAVLMGFIKQAGKIEHAGFVAVAGIEVFDLHSLFMVVQVVLLVAGFVALVYQCVRKEEAE